MARKRKTELDDNDSDKEEAYEHKRFKAGEDEDDWTPTRTSKGKSKGKNVRAPRSTAHNLEAAVSGDGLDHKRHSTSIHTLSQPELLREALVRWYSGVHASRGMPWRKPYDHSWNLEQKAQRAYEVWVSEVMLQQTQVATVIPYYNRWMQKYPTIRDLAASHIDTVNSLWKGLGYYSRAARLLSGAQKAVQQFDGRLPDNVLDMESKIPGIGRYSAGAICSIAYNQCVPVLDGNVHRLLSRLLALYAPPKAKQTLDILWSGASAFVHNADRPGDVNQALIELGSTVCKVRDPTCNVCPLQGWCAAYEFQEDHGREGKGANYAASTTLGDHPLLDIEELCSLCEPFPADGLVTAYPMKAEKKKAREELDIVNVIEWRGEGGGPRFFLLVRRPEGGLLAGLHEFPTAPNVPVTTSRSAQIAIVDTLLSALLISPPVLHPPQTSERSDSQGLASSRHPPNPPVDVANTLRIERVVPVGDVLHVFSHIKKTYRVQWVVLKGGTSHTPPTLIRNPEGEAFGPAQPKTSNGDTSRRSQRRTATSAHLTDKSQGSSASKSSPRTQWVPLESVADANIGTGVLKIWRQVRALWEDGEAEKERS